MNVGTLSTGWRGRWSWQRWVWVVLAVLLLVVWPANAHLAWWRGEWPLHGIPAFFLGTWVLVILTVVGWLQARQWSGGWRWLARGSTWRGVALGGALLVSLVALFYSVEWWRGHRAWTRVVAEAGLRGFSLEPVAPLPPVPAVDDLAQADFLKPLRQAVEALGTDRGAEQVTEEALGPLARVLQVSRSFPVDAGGQSYGFAPWLAGQPADLPAYVRRADEHAEAMQRMVRRLNGSAGSRGQGNPTPRAAAREPMDRKAAALAVLEVLEPLRAVLAEAEVASRRPACRLPVESKVVFIGTDTGERVLLAFARLHRVRALAELELGQVGEAHRDVMTSLRIQRHLATEPALYTIPQRTGQLAGTLQTVWEGMLRGCWSGAQLASLQDELALGGLIPARDEHIRLVVTAAAALVESLVPTHERTAPVSWDRNPGVERVFTWVRRLYPTGWSWQDQAALIETGLRWTADDVGGSMSPAPDPRPWLLRGTSDPIFPVFVAPKIRAMLADTEEQLPFGMALVRLAAVACALERARLADGEFPSDLAALVPRYLAELPQDPADGAPLRYRRGGGGGADQGGFVLYSVGANRADDGGRGERVEEGGVVKSPDWVWRVPGR